MTFPQGKRVIAGLAVLGIAFGMAGCSSDGASSASPGTAVESLGVRYTEADVTVSVDQVSDIVLQDLSRTDIVGMLAESQVMFAFAESQGLTITDEIIDQSSQQFLDSRAQTLVSSGQEAEEILVSDLSKSTKDILTYASIYQSLASVLAADTNANQQLMELMSAPNTVINPRYMVSTAQGLQVSGPFADVVAAQDTSSSAETSE